MHPIQDVDVILLMAITLASKRRPAELVEIVTAANLIHGSMPAEAKLATAFRRLSSHGLIAGIEDGFTLTEAAQQIMSGLSKKAETPELIFSIREKLSPYKPAEEYAAVVPTAEQLSAAIEAQRAAAKVPGKDLLVPKPKKKDEEDKRKRPGQWRRSGAPRKPRA